MKVLYARWISRLGAPLIAFVLNLAPSVSTVHAVENTRKVSVVSFGLFGDQGVFGSEATGAARVVAGRFGGAPINVQYNSKIGGAATIEGLAMSLQAAANGTDADNGIYFASCAAKNSRISKTERWAASASYLSQCPKNCLPLPTFGRSKE